MNETIKDLTNEVAALESWQQVATDSNKAVDDYLRKINPALPKHYGMPVDGVRIVVEQLRDVLEECVAWMDFRLTRDEPRDRARIDLARATLGQQDDTAPDEDGMSQQAVVGREGR